MGMIAILDGMTIRHSSAFLLADGFDRMPVWIDHEGGVVGRPLMGSNARMTVIGSTVSQRFGMEGVHSSLAPRALKAR
jgi:hypothetical protein